MKRLRLIGLNHRTAPVEVREKLALRPTEAAQAGRTVCSALGDASEAVVLSTCNRVELYTAIDADRADEADLAAVLCRCRGVDPLALQPCLYRHRGQETVRHLFRVAASLDSLVPGERQILGQVRSAYEISRSHGTAGPLLHGLFQRALAVGREVMQATQIGADHQSVGSAAVARVEAVFPSLAGRTVAVIGAGKMARLVLDRLRERRLGRLLICNRDGDRAAALAGRFGGEAWPLAELDRVLIEADIVIAATGSRLPIITAARLAEMLDRREGRGLFLIDIGVPRDVEPGAADLPGVKLLDIDDLGPPAPGSSPPRTAAMEAAERIVDSHVLGFLDWHRGRDVGPTIQQLYRRSHALVADELARTLRKLPDLGEPSRRQVEEMARRIVNKLLHDPVSSLREAAGEARHGLAYRHAVEKLFRLEEAREASGSREPADEPDPPLS